MENPLILVEAAHTLALTPYGPGMYSDLFERYQGCPPLHSHGIKSVPQQSPGALGTTGGLSIHTFRFMPIWIEMPWGEWYCWSRFDFFGPLRNFHAFKASLDIDPERCKFVGSTIEVIALRSVGGIVLPPYEACRINRSIDEWAALCLQHTPPYPVPEFWNPLSR